MDANVVHLIGKKLLHFQKNLGTSLQLEFGEFYRAEVYLSDVAGNLGLEDV